MKTLLILRHAKSSWNDEELDDHERPLNDRGKRDAPRVGELLREKNLVPDLVLCSTAVRARKTLARLIKTCKYEGETALQGQLYLAPPSAYLASLKNVIDDAQRVLVVGHNPGLEQLLFQLAGVEEPMPTAALAVVELPIDHWSELTESTRGELLQIYRPKELPDED